MNMDMFDIKSKVKSIKCKAYEDLDNIANSHLTLHTTEDEDTFNRTYYTSKKVVENAFVYMAAHAKVLIPIPYFTPVMLPDPEESLGGLIKRRLDSLADGCLDLITTSDGMTVEIAAAIINVLKSTIMRLLQIL